MRTFTGILCLALIVSCSDLTQMREPEENIGKGIEVTFHPRLDGSISSKAIGDAGSIDQLRVGIYRDNNDKLSLKEIMTAPWGEVQADGVRISFSDEDTYRILFWAEDNSNTAYSFKEDGSIVADYTDYLNGGFSKMEELDAFYATAAVIPGQSESSSQVILRRPMGQLNFADRTRPDAGRHKARITFHSIPVAYNPFTGKVKTTSHIEDSDDITFTFSDFPDTPLLHNGEEYHYVSCNYLFAPEDAPGEAACTIELEKDGKVMAHHEFKGKKSIIFWQREKINMTGYMVPEPVRWSEWNGRFPSLCTLTADPDDPDCYLIDDAEDIAWLTDADNAGSLGRGKTFRLVCNIDMGHKPSQKSMKLPEGSTFDGNNLTIKGVKMMTGLFGDVAVHLTVRNLLVEDAIISGTTNTFRGVLANTMSGSGSITNVTVADSYIRTFDKAAGGMVGYICRKNKSDRSEVLEVTFDDCHVMNTTIETEGPEGHFVGMFRGYDNGETIIFKDNCNAVPAAGAEPLDSYIIEGNEAVWIAGKDFSRYDRWIGREECWRGIVRFEDSRFIARWDGTTAVTPLLADPVYDDSEDHKVTAGNTRYMIYSPFDLAGARKATSSPMGLYFKESVDMNGQGEDGKYHVPAEFEKSRCESKDDNWFKRFSYVRDLDGQNHTIYNMSLHSHAVNDSSYVSAFIYSAQGGYVTTHRNLNFRNCCSVAPVVQRANSDQDSSNGAIFIFNTGPDKSGDPTYTMENIHIHDSKVFAIQHSGILAGILSRSIARNCSVNNCHIENFKCQERLEPFVKKVTIANNEIEISADFFSYGEIGGLFGNVRRQSDITDCHVRGTTIHAYGEPDKEADMYSEGVLGKLAIATAKGLGFYIVPGRHVSTLIGDIRTHSGETITISNCTVDAATRCTADHNKHNNAYPYIGQAYYIQFADTEGSVIVDGQELTLADGNRNTDR